ncbi:CynX/NimT family MFS transporter, partial [Pseudomonas sp. S44]|uniref:CynX/NimT family MFS transporter n=1 Tax=Pseudomonas sp. S44 TaxID=2767450 RepID=UPI00190E1023
MPEQLTSNHSKHDPELDELLIDAEADDEQVQQQPVMLRRPWLLLLGLVLVALNLRPALSSMAPVLGQVSEGLGLNASAAGLLTTLPVLCLGLFAPLAPILARRFGSERVILGILLTLALGILLRSALGATGVFVGSLIAGASIGIIGVLLPGIVKRDFPAHAGTLTGVYTMALCLGAAMAAGSTVPLSQYFGDSWAMGLGFWLLPALLAMLVWAPQARQGHGAHQVAYRVRGLWRDRLAWQVTLYMGLQSSLAYIVFGWLPSILIGRGLSPTQAGLVLSGSVLVQLISSLSAPWLATRGKDQRLAIVVVMLVTLGGLFGCLYAPISGLWGWAVLLGLGQGGTFALALTLIVLRSKDSHVAANLSSMAQGVGYTLASMGPFAVGLVHDLTDGWAAVGGIFAVLG